MKLANKILSFIVLGLLLILCIPIIVNAQQDEFILEAEQRWETYGIGGTCIPGTHNMAVADVDEDGVSEIVTGGFSYMTTNGTRTSLEAPLKIWSYDGENLLLEKTEVWSGAIWVVYCGDANGDGRIEIITSGYVIDNNQSVSVIRLWNWDGQELTLRGTYFDISASSIWVGDLNGDGIPEIVTVGGMRNVISPVAQLCIWNWNGVDLTLRSNSTWGNADGAQANSVIAGDIDKDGLVEIITAGYDNGLKNSSGQLRIWVWDGEKIELKANNEWRMVDDIYASDVAGNPMGNTIVSNVKIADLDSDGIFEILTGGFTYNGSAVIGQLCIWVWNGADLTLEISDEWAGYDITELKSITVNDVDGDGKLDIVGSGVTAGSGGFAHDAAIKEYAQLRVWSWDGQKLTLKQSRDWNVDEGVCAWQDGTADLDNDGKIEIITVGCSYKSTLCDPNLRIWSLPLLKTESSIDYTLITIAAVGTALIVIIIAVLVAMRKKQ